MKLFLAPNYGKHERGDGGVRRVVEAQRRLLPEYGIELVDDIEAAEVIAVHAGGEIPRWKNPDAARAFHCHGLYWSGYEWPNSLKKFNVGLIEHAHHADAVTTPCSWVADVFRREMWIDPLVIPNGIDVPEAVGESFGYVLWNKARVNAVCNPKWVEALARRAREIPFVSTFMPENDLRLKNVKVTGAVPYDRALEIVSHAGVYLSTTQEVFSVGVLEALSFGVPVLGFDWGGNREQVQHKVSGYLVPPGDVEGLREGLEYCLAHRVRLSEGARERAKEFTWTKATEAYAALYQRLYEGVVGGRGRPDVSVVIPCYNLGRFLPEAIDSVQLQGVSAEIIIVDDASPDPETIRAVNSYRSMENVTVIRNEKNLYLAHALNAGFAVARGKYMMALDADNRLPPNTLKLLQYALDKNQSYDCVYGPIQLITERGDLDERVGPQGIPTPLWPPAVFDLDKQLAHINQAPSTSLFRRSMWERARGYRQHAMFGDDADLWTRSAALGFKFKRVTSVPTLQYRNRNDSMTTTAGSDVHYDWTKWTPKHRPLMGVSYSPEVHATPKISIIVDIPPGKALQAHDAIESVWAQSFDDWEVVVPQTGLALNLPPYVKFGVEPSGETVLELGAHEWLEQDALRLLWEAYMEAPGERRLVYSDFTGYDVGDRGQWHTVAPQDRAARMDGQVGVVLRPRHSDVDLAIHLAVPVVNRRESEGGRLLACATCGGGSRRAHVQAPNQSMASSARMRSAVPTGEQDTVLVEFTGHGSRTYSPVAGVTYRFGEDREHRQRRIVREHVGRLANMRDFRIITDDVVISDIPPVAPSVDVEEAVKQAVAASKR